MRDDKDPTYPDQTTLGARLKVAEDTSIFYTQRISDEAIVPIGDFAATGFSELATKGELNIGVESQVKDATQLTSGYRVEQGVNGPDAFALIGVFTHIKLGRTVGTSFGLERGQLIDGEADSYTSGSFAVDWLPSDRFKATTRYEGRDRGGYSSRLSAGVAARLHAGVTGLTRVQWAESADKRPPPATPWACSRRWRCVRRRTTGSGGCCPISTSIVTCHCRRSRPAARHPAGVICSRPTATRSPCSGSSSTASSRGSDRK